MLFNINELLLLLFDLTFCIFFSLLAIIKKCKFLAYKLIFSGYNDQKGTKSEFLGFFK